MLTVLTYCNGADALLNPAESTLAGAVGSPRQPGVQHSTAWQSALALKPCCRQHIWHSASALTRPRNRLQACRRRDRMVVGPIGAGQRLSGHRHLTSFCSLPSLCPLLLASMVRNHKQEDGRIINTDIVCIVEAKPSCDVLYSPPPCMHHPTLRLCACGVAVSCFCCHCTGGDASSLCVLVVTGAWLCAAAITAATPPPCTSSA